MCGISCSRRTGYSTRLWPETLTILSRIALLTFGLAGLGWASFSAAYWVISILATVTGS